MGKKKPYGKIALTVMLILMFVFVGLASALEQEFNPGFEDKKGTLGVDTKSWRAGWINSTFMEGPTSDAFHTVFSATDPTAINRILLPDESGTVITTGGAADAIPLADTKILVGQSDGISEAKTMSGDVSILNTGETFIEAGTDAQLLVYNAGDGWGPDTMSGDVTIDNDLVASIGANKIGVSEFNLNTISVGIATGQTSGTALVVTGSTVLGGAYAFANVDAEVANITAISGQTLTVTLIAAAANASVVFKVDVLEP